VPKNRKGAEIALAARRFRDDTTLVMASTEAWRTMAREMGVENMGGPAIGFQAALPTPTVTYGAVMHHDDATGRMVGMKHGEMTGAHRMGDTAAITDMPGMTHTAPAVDSARRGAEAHAGHEGMPRMPNAKAAVDSSRSTADLRALHARMMADSVIHARVMADLELHRLMERVMGETLQHMPGTTHDPAAVSRPRTPRRTMTMPAAKSSAKPVAKRGVKPAAKPAAKPTDPHAGHNMPGMGGMKMPAADSSRPSKP
jgi:hypothetical protein